MAKEKAHSAKTGTKLGVTRVRTYNTRNYVKSGLVDLIYLDGEAVVLHGGVDQQDQGGAGQGGPVLLVLADGLVVLEEVHCGQVDFRATDVQANEVLLGVDLAVELEHLL